MFSKIVLKILGFALLLFVLGSAGATAAKFSNLSPNAWVNGFIRPLAKNTAQIIL